jgi:hypothetical protein
MLKDLLRMAVMTSVLLFAMFAFFAFVALLIRLSEILPQYIGGFMTFWVIIATMMLFFAICYYIVKHPKIWS